MKSLWSNLSSSVKPYSWLEQAVQLWQEHVSQASSGTLQGQSSDEEDGHDNVGEECGEVDDLSGRLNAFHNDQERTGTTITFGS